MSWVPWVPQTPRDQHRTVPSSDAEHPQRCPHACQGDRAVGATTMLAPKHSSPDPPLCQGLLQWEPADSHGNLPSGREKCISLRLPSRRKTSAAQAGTLPRLLGDILSQGECVATAPGDGGWLQALPSSPRLRLPGSTAGFTALGCSRLHARLLQVKPQVSHTQEGSALRDSK